MQEFATYKNKHTGEIAKYLRHEYVLNYPKPTSVHVVLLNGKEDVWNDELFLAHWDLLGWYA